eukprot:CAMPEP_0114583328 /NCGR_PEP_ID=MMETSP0125-20121206/7085_1 /TAXON_ID=485358 ORGANISM="Aristerostoma sp., Strain ATCC 50986" /NCGR_SAMPLE_ID=MMETSP0125 /ASSEMBLY_ACC=CAM_ASM_000245 /LENGTH=121 /DNA_ID=CAMNT_0001776723 /DNA_START=1495 /DNA_END=1859 /DNA_ORIENTATION=+
MTSPVGNTEPLPNGNGGGHLGYNNPNNIGSNNNNLQQNGNFYPMQQLEPVQQTSNFTNKTNNSGGSNSSPVDLTANNNVIDMNAPPDVITENLLNPENQLSNGESGIPTMEAVLQKLSNSP